MKRRSGRNVAWKMIDSEGRILMAIYKDGKVLIKNGKIN
jgi:hypothetical protein